MSDAEKIEALRKMLIYFIDLYFGPRWHEITKDNGYVTFYKLDEARKLLMVTQ